MEKNARPLGLVLASVALFSAGCQELGTHLQATAEAVTIVCPQNAAMPERLAAKEIRRYLYLRTGKLLPIVSAQSELPSRTSLIVVAEKDQPAARVLMPEDARLAVPLGSLGPQQYLLMTVARGEQRILLIAGGDPIGTLYGAYRFAEHLGVRFYLHGDTIPDERIVLSLPELDERGRPLFNVRGIQPFHDFPEGPDWWNTDDYKAVIAQLPKLRMNFLGLHTYPQGGAGPEPTVWIGLAEDAGPDGKVRFSSPSSYQNTLRGNWGYSAKKTGMFSFGAAELFERDDYGPEVMFGMMPWPETLEQRDELFNRVGDMLGEAFEWACALGVKTCVGTEIPLVIPDVVKERIRALGKDPAKPAVVQEVYEGMFRRIMKAYPLDYYWFWTPEDWTWRDPKDEQVEATLTDLRAAMAAAENVDAQFTLATCGWVLGPPSNRALFDQVLSKDMPISCINRNVGFSPVEPGFAHAKGRPKWAIPWMEDDPAMIIPQLWVGRMRRDAADALAYGCTGLLGIHWRTRILGPNVSALAHAAWDQHGWNPDIGKTIEPPDPELIEGREGGNVANFPNNPIADTEDDPLYQSVTWDVKAYRLRVPNGTYTVTLKFCEPHYDAKGKRVFSVTLQDKKVIDRLDVFGEVGKNRALDYTFEGVNVLNDIMKIGFVSEVEYPCIAAFVIQGQGFSTKVNCGGPAYKDYDEDMAPSAEDTRSRDLPADDLYGAWALTQFGPEAAEPIAELFSRLDGGPVTTMSGQRKTNLPRPSTWVNGPGGITPDERPWEQVSKEYQFVDELADLRPQVKGAGNRERFDYWLNNFRYLRAVGRVNCTWARFNGAMKKVKEEKDPEAQKELALKTALPIRRELIEQVADVHRHLLATVTTTGGMGTVANWQQHLMPTLLTQPGQELAQILGEELPADAMPHNRLDGPPRIIVPTLRSSLTTGEDLKLKVILLGAGEPQDAALYWRQLGRKKFNRITLSHIARSVYSAKVPAQMIGHSDLEYHIVAHSAIGREIVFPAGAPRANQTVVVVEP
ncbi:MAG: hypothetical protein JSU70_09325 [Phycisphaerales bacterium]|nr:MAG: hypothetical protein JSU70_09325 [Phycisphaerales bacterium]